MGNRFPNVLYFPVLPCELNFSWYFLNFRKTFKFWTFFLLKSSKWWAFLVPLNRAHFHQASCEHACFDTWCSDCITFWTLCVCFLCYFWNIWGIFKLIKNQKRVQNVVIWSVLYQIMHASMNFDDRQTEIIKTPIRNTTKTAFFVQNNHSKLISRWGHENGIRLKTHLRL